MAGVLVEHDHAACLEEGAPLLTKRVEAVGNALGASGVDPGQALTMPMIRPLAPSVALFHDLGLKEAGVAGGRGKMRRELGRPRPVDWRGRLCDAGVALEGARGQLVDVLFGEGRRLKAGRYLGEGGRLDARGAALEEVGERRVALHAPRGSLVAQQLLHLRLRLLHALRDMRARVHGAAATVGGRGAARRRVGHEHGLAQKRA